MICSALRRQLMTAAVLPFVMFASVAMSSELFLCQMDGITKSCCCPHEKQAPPAQAALERTPCCDQLEQAPVATHSASATQQQEQVKQPITVAVSSPSSMMLAPVGTPPRLRIHDEGPRTTTGPPIFLRHRVLLI